MLCAGQVGYRISKQGCNRKLQSVSPWFPSLFLVVDGGGKKRKDADIAFGLPVASVDRMSPSVILAAGPLVRVERTLRYRYNVVYTRDGAS